MSETPQSPVGPVLVEFETFNIGEFEFDKPQDKNENTSVDRLFRFILLNLATLKNPDIRKILKDSGVKIADRNGKRYFPQDYD